MAGGWRSLAGGWLAVVVVGWLEAGVARIARGRVAGRHPLNQIPIRGSGSSSSFARGSGSQRFGSGMIRFNDSDSDPRPRDNN